MRTGRRAELLGVKLGCPRIAAAPSFQTCFACVHMYILYEFVNMCMCVCVRTWYMYMYACVFAFVHLCDYTHVYVYVYAYLCIDCGSWYHCFSVWTVSCMRVCLRVHMRAYMYVRRYIYMCAFFCSECYVHFTGALGTSAWAVVYVTEVCFNTNVHICEHTHCRLWTVYFIYVYMHA